ncbi:hypothetical protein NXT08_08295 [Rhodococcus pyridinivorans]|jgi:hypothetical protein|uniref:Uncharacterized protein n=3 Tax=Rhodococcus TaxID=1827 RepID=A0A562DMC3_RHORH|nr:MULTISPECIES: hypothetical protein [Rhodococcus]MBX4168012.1 hypothetical protein [Rhodococcus sp. DMU2021]MCD2112179.1 hypothetical protein [Rhodococcus rhodochrous]MCD5419154.1 hypothetical protein [Rhodococcus pyridinivorans]MCR8694153.1 hypothetical protein [Rhodococcus pyridinivorans]QOV99860.1 hypothetical protein INP59_05675 [Rhodococcus pyridinivorans]
MSHPTNSGPENNDPIGDAPDADPELVRDGPVQRRRSAGAVIAAVAVVVVIVVLLVVFL